MVRFHLRLRYLFFLVKEARDEIVELLYTLHDKKRPTGVYLCSQFGAFIGSDSHFFFVVWNVFTFLLFSILAEGLS